MIEVADEVYVISPLGKIFVGHEKHKVNRLLRDIAEDKNSAYKHSYKELDTNKMHFFNGANDGDRNSEKIKLVTTYRSPVSLLHESSERIFEYLNASKDGQERINANILKVNKKNHEEEKAKFCLQDIKDAAHLMFEFEPSEKTENKAQKGIFAQLAIDFPHLPTQNREFLEAFYVSEDRLVNIFSKNKN